MRSHDAIIVGGGHNGLTAAAFLARAGRSCLVLERLDRVGGAAVSEQLFSGHDARLSRYAYLVSLLPQAIVDELRLPVTLMRRSVSSYTPDPRAGGERGLLVDPSQPAQSRRSFRAVSGGGPEGWERLYALTGRVAEAVFPTLTEPLRSREQLRASVGEADWKPLFERPIEESVRELIDDDLIAGVALTDALIGTFADARAGSLLANRCFLYHVIGRGTGEWLVPAGGMGTVTGALASAVRAGGGELQTGAAAVAIEPGARGAGARVRYLLDGEERVAHGRVLLFGGAPAELSRLLGDSPADEPTAEGSQLKVNLLLSRLPRLRDPSVESQRAFAGTFHVNETASQLRAAYEQAAAGEIPALPPCEAYCHSLTDPSILGDELRREGAQTLTVFTLHMPARLFVADPDGARERALAATLASLDSVLAEPIEDCVMNDAEGRPCIEARSPLDLERELRMPGGHIFHRDLSWPFAERSEEVGSWGVETVDPAVLLCGAGARRGGGVSGIPGYNGARAAARAAGW